LCRTTFKYSFYLIIVAKKEFDMVYKKYVFKNGKKMGPYYYESYRDGIHIKKRYLGTSYSEKNFLWLYVLLGVALILLVFFLFLWKNQMTGRSSLEIAPQYSVGEIISGNLAITLQAGELIPKETKVIASLGSQHQEIELFQLTNENLVSGDFYAIGTNLSGEGEGFGVTKNSLLYPNVDFDLLISETAQSAQLVENITPINTTLISENKIAENISLPAQNQSTTAQETPQNTTPPQSQPSQPDSEQNKQDNKDKENKKTKGASAESSEQAPSQPEVTAPPPSEKSSETNSNQTSTTPITGAAASQNENDFIISKKVSKDKDFTYTLEPGQTASIVSGSVKYNKENIGDDKITLAIMNNTVTVSTNYLIIKTPPGQERKNETLTLNINLSRFNISAVNGTLLIELQYKNTQILSLSKNIKIESTEQQIPQNETNATQPEAPENITNITIPEIPENVTNVTNITIPNIPENINQINLTETNVTITGNKTYTIIVLGNKTLFSNIPMIKIIGNDTIPLNLSYYFLGADNYAFNGTNVLSNLTGDLLSLSANPSFKGYTKGKVSAYKENTFINEIEFPMLISTGDLSIQTTRAKVESGLPVKWTKEVSAEVAENLSLELPSGVWNISVKKIENGISKQIAPSLSLITGNAISGRVSAEIELENKNHRLLSWLKNLWNSFANRRITANVISADATSAFQNESAIQVLLPSDTNQYIIEYYTIPPKIEESDTPSGREVIVSAPDVLNYTDVIATASIGDYTNPAYSIKLYWHNKEFRNATYDLTKKADDIASASLIENTTQIAENSTTLLKKTEEALKEVTLTINLTNSTLLTETAPNQTRQNNSLLPNNLFIGNATNENSTNTPLSENLTISSGAHLTGMVSSELIINPEPEILSGSELVITDSQSSLKKYPEYILQEIPFDSYDYDEDGKIDHIAWVVPHLSNQTYQIVLSSQNTTTTNITYDGDYSHLTMSTNAPYSQSGYGIIAYWNFDGDNSSTTFDYSANDKDGAYRNETYSDSAGCIYGKCAKFNSINTSITRTLSPAPTQFTITAWINLSQITKVQHIAEFTNTQFYVNDNDILDTSGWSTATGNNALSAGNWYFVSLTRNNTNVTLYLNGNVEGIGNNGATEPTSSFYIGRYYSTGDYFFNGSIDEVMVFNFALNSSQITDIYNNQSARFVPSGTEEAKQFSVSAGTKTINVGINNYQRKVNSNIQLRLGTWASSFGYKNWDFGEHRLFLDGKDDYVNITSSPLNFTSAFSYGAWFKANLLASWAGIITNNIGSPTYNGYNLQVGNAQQIACFSGDSGSFRYTNSNSAPLNNTWYHAMCVFNGTAMRLYVNGVLQNDIDNSISIGASNVSAKIGLFYTYSSTPLNGTIDEIMLFNRSLNASEVQKIYEAGRDPGEFTDSSLVSWWDFNDGTANDRKAINNGTFQSGAYVQHDQTPSLVSCWHLDSNYKDSCRNVAGTAINNTAVVAGIYSTATSFDGDGDYINDSSFYWNSTGGPVTVAFWNKVNTNQVKVASAFSVNFTDIPDRFQAHVPYSDRILYWDYGNYSSNGRISADYTNYLDKWTHVALTSDGRGGSYMKIYLDGQLINSTSPSDGPTINLSSLYIGKFYYYPSHMNDDHNGSIDEFMIFNRSLSAAEIKELYTKGRARWEYSTTYQNLTAANSADTQSRNNFLLSTTSISNILPSFKLLASPYQFYTPILSSNSTFTFNVLRSKVTNCTTGSNCLFIQTGYGTRKAIFDKFGNIDIAGTLTEKNAGIPDGHDFIIKNKSGSVVAWVDNNTGDMQIAGSATPDMQSYCTPPSNSFVIKDSSGNCVSYVDSSGNLWASGLLNQQAII
jgi:hypothetical protein